MTRIFLVRHGEAEGNLYRRAQGQFDAALTPRGRAQLQRLVERFQGETLDAAYSSDLSRAYETARAVAEAHGLAVTRDPRLREMGLGVWENVPWGDIAWREPEQLRYFGNDPARWTIPGREPFEALQDRMEEALLEIAGRHPGQTVLCASHGMAIRSLLARLLQVPSAEIRRVPHADNTAVALLLAQDGRLRPEFYNDSSHLPRELSSMAGQDWWKSNGGSDSRNLRYEPLDPDRDRELYLDCYRDAWRGAHQGRLDGFHPDSCWQSTLSRAAASPWAVTRAMLGDRFAGFLALDERRGAGQGLGWISFCYIAPQERRRRCGIQLIGCAVARYRQLGRRRLCLTVAPGNPALEFYRRAGFLPAGEEEGALEPLLRMEKPL